MDALLLGYISADHFVYSCAVWSQVYANKAAKMADRVNTVLEYFSLLWKNRWKMLLGDIINGKENSHLVLIHGEFSSARTGAVENSTKFILQMNV